MMKRPESPKPVEPHAQCRAWYSDRDILGQVWRVQCILTAGHPCSEHLGKDPNGTLIRWNEFRGEWEVR